MFTASILPLGSSPRGNPDRRRAHEVVLERIEMGVAGWKNKEGNHRGGGGAFSHDHTE